MSFIRTGLREIGLRIRRQRTRMILRHEKRLLQKSEIALGREGTSQAANFPELRNEIVALKKLEQEQKEVALRIVQIEEGIKKIEAQRQANGKEQSEAMAKLGVGKKPILQRRNKAKNASEVCGRRVNALERRKTQLSKPKSIIKLWRSEKIRPISTLDAILHRKASLRRMLPICSTACASIAWRWIDISSTTTSSHYFRGVSTNRSCGNSISALSR